MNSGSKIRRKSVLARYRHLIAKETGLVAGDRERERLGRELHDGLCQNLAGIAALGATLARKLAARNDPAQGAAAEIVVFLQQAIGDARDLAHSLNAGGV